MNLSCRVNISRARGARERESELQGRFSNEEDYKQLFWCSKRSFNIYNVVGSFPSNESMQAKLNRSKHILNAQVSIRSPCCKSSPPLPTQTLLLLENPSNKPPGRKWFDCAECHLETEDHPLLQKTEMVLSLPLTCPLHLHPSPLLPFS
jgi:hypothetical protein